MAYKTFANGFPLPASDLNNFLMNQSVIVFADSAARTTAIPSPVTGMLTYLEDTSTYESWNGSAYVDLNDNTDAIPKSTVTNSQDLIVADGASSVTRLGVGTDDQVLSVVGGSVAWADAGGGGGSSLVWTQIFSGALATGAATATITGLSGYDNYTIRTSAVSGNSANTSWTLLLNGDSTSVGAYSKLGQGPTEIGEAFAVTDIPIGVTNLAIRGINSFLKITGASGTSSAEVSIKAGSSGDANGDFTAVGGVMAVKDSLALASIAINASVGTIDGGSVTIWGA